MTASGFASRVLGTVGTVLVSSGGGGPVPVTPGEIDAIAAAAATRVWDELTATTRTAGSFGALVRTDLDATVSSRATPADVSAVASQLTALSSQVGTPAQAAALLTARDLILAQVATRATPADVNVTVTPPIDATVEVS